MNKGLKVGLKIINVLALAISAAWAWNQRDFEPIISTLGLLATLIGLYVTDDKPKPPTMSQRSGKASTNYQSSGSITINTPHKP